MLEQKTLVTLQKTLCDERSTAINGRKREGLDAVWQKARNQYKGKDELNTAASMEKGETLNSSISAFRPAQDSDRSTVFVNMTRPYTNAGTARVTDILLPTGKMPWELKSTPVSDLQTVMGVLGKFPAVAQALSQVLPDIGKKLDPNTTEAALEVATTIIKDWLKESDWSNVVQQQLSEAGIVGTGVIKGPVPKERKLSKDVTAIVDVLPEIASEDVAALLSSQLETMIFFTPQIECIPVENCFPDPECGSDVQNGRFFFEKIPEVTRRQLRKMKEDPNFIAEAIDLCLDEGPLDETGKAPKHENKEKPFVLWIRTGVIEYKSESGDMKSLGFGTVTMCNERIIKIAPYPLETEHFPYHMLCWEPRDNSWAGIGIPEQMETPQRGLNSSVRALMDNMGYSVGPQVLELEGIIEPMEGEGTKMHPYKRWRVKSGLPGVDAMSEAQKAMAFLEFPNYLNEIMPVIQYWLKMAEDTTGLSLLLQGQAVTDAVGVSQQLMNNSTTNLRLIVKGWDNNVCKPLLTAFYEWVQLYGPEEAQGDAVVEPIASSALIIKELQQQALLQIGQQVLQPVYGVSPSKWMAMYLEGFQIDVEKMALTDEERERLEAAEAQPDPKVEAAKIEAQMEYEIAKLQDHTDKLKLALEAQFKQLSLAQAAQAAELNARTQMATGEQKLQQEQLKQQGAMQQKGMEIEANPAMGSPELASGEQLELNPPEPPTEGPPPQDVDAALATLGLQ